MINTLTLLFHLRVDKRNQNGKSPIFCRITVEKERSTFSLQRAVYPDKWDAAKEIVKGNTEEAKNINAYISLIKNKIYEAHYKLVDSNTPVNAHLLKRLVQNKDRIKSKSVFRVFEDHNQKVKTLIGSTFAYGTYERYQTALKHLKDFVAWKYSRNDFFLHEIDHEFVAEYDFYLRSVRKCNNNTSVKYIKNFGKIIRYSIANAWIDKNPFLNFKMKLSKVDRGYLNKEELTMLVEKHFSINRLEQVKDVFLFQCFTGLAYCDVCKLTHENITSDDNNILWLKTKRTKTDTAVNVPLLPGALQIIEKYSNNKTRSSEKLLPVPSNQKLNAYLKEIGELTGINKRLSCHLARHTFATTVTLANGISLESVSKMLGHTNLTTTKIYARMLDSRVLDEMQLLHKKLNNKKES
jgi:site-specific recombinase XerD